MTIKASAAIVGAAQVDTWKSAGRSPVGLMGVAVVRALADAGLALSDVDGLFTSSSYYAMPTLTLGEYLGIHPTYSDSTSVGGCAFVAQLGHAAAAIQAGLCSVAVIAYGSTQRSDAGKLVSMAEQSAYEAPYGLLHPVGAFGMVAQRHMAQYGTTSEQLAELAVAARRWSLLVDDAPFDVPLSVEDVLSSPMIATPLHKFDCCLVTDGGGAVVLMSSERAKDVAPHPVYLLGVGEALNHRNFAQMPDLTTTEAGRSSSQALHMAGAQLDDIDTVHVYDAFTISLLVLLEDLGFCAKGEGGSFVEDGAVGPGGRVALNTNGGGLSYCHPGMLSLFLIIEAVQQLRGQAGRRQVPDARLSLVHGMGMTLAAHASAVLSNTPYT